MEANKVIVAEWDLPYEEGSLEVMVGMENKNNWLDISVTGPFFLWHKPYCGAPVCVKRVTDQKMVLFAKWVAVSEWNCSVPVDCPGLWVSWAKPLSTPQPTLAFRQVTDLHPTPTHRLWGLFLLKM